MWATDSNKVQEFMFSYLKDPLREVEQPYFHQDEVHPLSEPPFLLQLFLYYVLVEKMYSCLLQVMFSDEPLLHCCYMWGMLRNWHGLPQSWPKTTFAHTERKERLLCRMRALSKPRDAFCGYHRAMIGKTQEETSANEPATDAAVFLCPQSYLLDCRFSGLR